MKTTGLIGTLFLTTRLTAGLPPNSSTQKSEEWRQGQSAICHNLEHHENANQSYL